jgi:hypothetical protein
MTEQTQITIIAVTGPIISTVLAAILPPILRKILKSRKPTSATEIESSRKPYFFTYFFRILLLGFSLTAIASALVLEHNTAKRYTFATDTVEALKQQLAAQQKALGPISGADNPKVTHSGDSVAIEAPPGFYVNGISFQMQSGGAHGQVYNITPLFKPFTPPAK